MKNYIAVLFATLLLSLSGLSLAKDVTNEMGPDLVTVNVNEADAQSIADALLGVGLTRAQAIVDYRDAHGRFYTAEELTAVKGIGQSTVDRNVERILLK